MEFCKVTLTFESEDKILWSDHSNETSLPVLSHGTICFFMVQFFLLFAINFILFVRFCIWPHLAGKG